MAEKPLEVMYLENNDDDDNDDDNDNEDDGVDESDYFNDEGSMRCLKIQLPENIAAYLEKKVLLRDVEPLPCDNNLMDKVTSNYIIAKQIISNLPWQDKVLCKHVCTTWLSAVRALQREQLSPEDFVVDLKTYCSTRVSINYKKLGPFYTEPLVVLTFANTVGINVTYKCKVITPRPCEPACEKEHCLIDLLQQNVCAPKDCMLTVRASKLSYMPLPHTKTYDHMITNHMFKRLHPFVGGIYIPAIPDVKFHVINIKSNSDMQQDFFDAVDKLAQNRIFKGVLVYVTDKYLLNSVEDIVFLNYFKKVQPDIPYALGGCIVEDAISQQKDICHIIEDINEGNDFISENLISIGLFTVPKNTNNVDQGDKYNFDMYSLILESSDWGKTKIQRAITEFSRKVPHFEHSVVLKLSCVGRDLKHKLEQDYFRAAFPHTRLIGCYGNGELGINHPARTPPDTPQNAAKRHRSDPEQFGIMYSYSTVFVYIGWGKITSQQGLV